MAASALEMEKQLSRKSVNDQQMKLPAGTFEWTIGGYYKINEYEGVNEKTGKTRLIYNLPIHGQITEVESVEDQDAWDMYEAMNSASPNVSFKIDLRSSYNRNVRQLSKALNYWNKEDEDSDQTLLEEMIDANLGETVKVEVTYKTAENGVTYTNLNFLPE